MNLISQFINDLELNQVTVQSSFDTLHSIFKQSIDDDQIITLLQAINTHGIDATICTGFAQAMRTHMTPIHLQSPVIDCCGTGGSGKIRFNTSTAAAFILAAMGVPVAKHGNVGSRSPNGSFDFLKALNIPYESINISQWESIFRQFGLCFLFAKQFHPAMKTVGPARAKMGSRSIFNCLGPLCNPASATHQIIGVSEPKLAKVLAQTLQNLGIKHAIIIVGHNGLDELSNTGPSEIHLVHPNTIQKQIISPEDFGFRTVSIKDIEGGSATQNGDLFLELLKSKTIDHPIMELILMNVAAASHCIGHSKTLQEGLQSGIQSVQSGKAKDFFDQYQSTLLEFTS